MRRFLRALALAGFCVLVGEAAIVTIDALLRSFLSAPIAGLSEVVDITTATVIATCIPVVVAQRRNIQVKLLSGAVGPRMKVAIEIWSHAFLLVFLAVVAYQLAAHAIDVASIGERSLILLIPLAPFWIAAAAIVALSVPSQIIVICLCGQRFLAASDGRSSAR